jgi:hypothetical protein
MKKTAGLLIALGLVVSPALAAKVEILYDKDYDFDSIESFKYVDTSTSNSKDPEVDAHIRAKIVDALTSGGLTQLEDGADLYITYHIAGPDGRAIDADTDGYEGSTEGLDPWGVGGWGTKETTPSTYYVQGTLIIDAYNPETGLMVWRATSKVEVKDTTKGKIKAVDSTFKKIDKRWDKILAGEGK